MPPPVNRSLPLCEVLEDEYRALTGDDSRARPDVRFAPQHILEPRSLARRLIDGTDRVVTALRRDLLADLVSELVAPFQAGNIGVMRTVIATGFNRLLPDERLFDAAHQPVFASVKFRSQTVDHIGAADIPWRNRLILEDTFPELRTLFDIRLAEGYQRMHEQQLRALCLSGGGIRSATFSLGVSQGLAHKGLLDQFDYLSTVSGGGFTGGWLSAWIARTSLPQVVAQLRERPKRPLDPEPGPVRHLRSFTNYLTPRLGLFSADAWTLGATYLRNLLLNWLAFVPPLAALLSLPLLLGYLVTWRPVGVGTSVQYVAGLVFAAVAVIGAVAAVHYVYRNRPRQHGTEGTDLFDEKRSQRDFVRQCLGPLVVAATAAVICWAWGTSYSSPIGDLFQQAPGWLTLGATGAAVNIGGWLLAIRDRPASHRPPWWHPIAVLASGFALGTFASVLTLLAPPLWQLTPAEHALYVWLAVPVILTVILLSSHLYVGYSSTHQADAEREWSARFTGWVLIAVTAWVAAFGLVIFGPTILAFVGRTLTAGRALVLAWALSAVSVMSGIGATVVAGRAGSSAVKPGNAARTRSRLGLTLATVFIAWLAVALASAAGALIDALQRTFDAAADSTRGLAVAAATVAGLLLFGLITGRLIDTNMFSLHGMYRARLIRAWLGASRPAGDRDPNPFTGFDDGDNLHLRELWPQPADPGGNHQPLHIINATLNLVGGDKLAWQERKAESFTFSPLHCGSANVGYRRTQEDARDPSSSGYAGTLGATLGTALAISGAAGSPEMGYHSSAVLSLLLTFFNVRLGWWLGNPGHAGRNVYHRSSPVSSLRPIVDEALGRTDDRNKYVYLSDGGHFENLGLYEMVLRRCHVIVVCDASCDPDGSCEDLGQAIRKIRIDLGIPIDIDLEDRAVRHASCAVGAIRYGAVDRGAPEGVLIYFKPESSSSDPADVRAYAHTHPAFPHESTTDQWFTESQFESYRQLGAHIIEERADEPPEAGATMAWFINQVQRHRAL